MTERFVQLFQKPFAPLLPWAGMAGVLWLVVMGVHQFGVVAVETERARLEREWTAARQLLALHREAKKAERDLAQVWALLPGERDFAPLALGISDEAKQDHVALPALSYKTEATGVGSIRKGLLHGSISGRYEDLRRFIHDLETAEELLFIEDLELTRAGQQEQGLTFNIKIATYLRADPVKPASPSTKS